jgi:carbonic anhydrase
MKSIIIAILMTSLFSLAKDHGHSEDPKPSGQFVDESNIQTPDRALAELIKGNKRFLEKKTLKQDFLSQIKATSGGQHPYAVILSCLDSRVPPEIVFDQGIGDLFVARVAGNIENQDILGSFEFATQVKGSKLIVVLGHTSCGAVEGACQEVKLGNLTGLLSEIEPAVKKTAKNHPGMDKKSKQFVEHVSDENVKQTVKDLIKRSDIIQALVKEGKLKVVGAKYDVSNGKVTFFE